MLTEDEAEEVALDRYLMCANNDVCDRACEMHTVESTWNWLRCEECPLWRRDGER